MYVGQPCKNMVHLRPRAFMRTPDARQENRKPRLESEAIQLPTSSENSKSHSSPYFQTISFS